MALQKTIVQDNGVVLQYHRIGEASLNHNGVLFCRLDSYVSHDYAAQGLEVDSYVFMFNNVPIEEEESMGIRKLAYMKIKREQKWQDAIDC